MLNAIFSDSPNPCMSDVCVYVSMYVRVCMYACLFVCVYVLYIHVCMYVSIYTIYMISEQCYSIKVKLRAL